MQIGDYTAHVLVDDQELEEYGIQFETPTRVTCWIASEEGKTFGVQWRCRAETRTNGSVGWLTVDYTFCDGSPMYPGPLGDGDTAEIYNISTNTKTREFVFSRIQLSDDESLLNKKTPQGFGEISLEIEHGRLVKGRRLRNTCMGIPDGDDKFHETSNKAAHHRVGFGPERARKERLRVSHLIVNDETSLFFVFKYRPIALLRAHGIVPTPIPAPDATDKTPSPKPDPDRSQSNGLHAAELRERIRNLKNELKRLQDLETGLSEKPRSKRIKYEDSGPGDQSHSVAIDLTKD